MTRTGQDAIDYARGRIGPNAMPASGYCLKFVREVFDVGSYYGSAIDAWNGARWPHPGDRNPPPAVPLYFLTPSIYDHVTFNVDGSSEVISTFNADVRAFDGIDGIERNFTGTYLGWAEDINGVRVYTPESEASDMTPEESQRLINVEGAVGRLETIWGAADQRNRVGNADETHDWSKQTTEAVGRVETTTAETAEAIEHVTAGVSASSWSPTAVVAALALGVLALMVVTVLIISAATGTVPADLERAAVYLAFALAGGLLTRLLGRDSS